MADYGIDDLIDLRDKWEEVFGSPMPMGFEIGPNQVPILKKCLESGDQKPLIDYVESIPEDITY